MIINLTAQAVAFLVSFTISFFVTPTIIAAVGKETYGYLGLANSFSGYISVVTVALNALAGRFVTISIHRENLDEANAYFSSVFLSNLAIVLTLTPIAMFGVANLEKIMELPPHSASDIKITFLFVFASFFLNLAGSIFSVATFATNKIYLSSLRNIQANLVRIGLILVLFYAFEPKISYVSCALFASNVLVVYTNFIYTKKLLPRIKVSFKSFSKEKVKELLLSGCWNSITALSNMLLEGLDLLISNLFISASAMGIVAIVKTVPNMLNQCLGTLLNVFLPQLTIDYARSSKENMVSYIDSSCKLIGMLFSIPVAFMLVFGEEFFRLWMPTENSTLLWWLSVLSLGALYFVGSANIMYNLYTVTNKLKLPAFVTLLSGILNTVTVLILLNITDLGIIAVVSVSSIIALLRNIIFNIPYSARCIGQKVGVFYKFVARSLAMVVLVAACGLVVRTLFLTSTWIELIFSGAAMGITGLMVNFVLFYTAREKREMVTGIVSRIRRSKHGK